MSLNLHLYLYLYPHTFTSNLHPFPSHLYPFTPSPRHKKGVVLSVTSSPLILAWSVFYAKGSVWMFFVICPSVSVEEPDGGGSVQGDEEVAPLTLPSLPVDDESLDETLAHPFTWDLLQTQALTQTQSPTTHPIGGTANTLQTGCSTTSQFSSKLLSVCDHSFLACNLVMFGELTVPQVWSCAVRYVFWGAFRNARH